jgi:hypothetical protein
LTTVQVADTEAVAERVGDVAADRVVAPVADEDALAVPDSQHSSTARAWVSQVDTRTTDPLAGTTNVTFRVPE